MLRFNRELYIILLSIIYTSLYSHSLLLICFFPLPRTARGIGLWATNTAIRRNNAYRTTSAILHREHRTLTDESDETFDLVCISLMLFAHVGGRICREHRIPTRTSALTHRSSVLSLCPYHVFQTRADQLRLFFRKLHVRLLSIDHYQSNPTALCGRAAERGRC